MCRFVPWDEKLQRMPNRDAYEVRFRFDLVPADFFGQPDEGQHTERVSVRITVTGPSFCREGIPEDEEPMMRVLYWHAVKTLERGEDSLDIDVDYAMNNRVNPSKIAFPPTGPFQMLRTVKMGFGP
jgi:hypothetical protein